MSSRRRMLNILLVLTAYTLVMCQVLAHADSTSPAYTDPPSSNAELRGNKLTDQIEIENSARFYPDQLPIYEEKLKPMIEFARSFPELAPAVNRVMKMNFFFTSLPLDKCNEPQSYSINGKKVACMEPPNIIFSDWDFHNLDPNDPELKPIWKKLTKKEKQRLLEKKQKALFAHEIVKSRLFGTSISNWSGDQTFELLTRDPLPGREEALLVLKNFGFGTGCPDFEKNALAFGEIDLTKKAVEEAIKRLPDTSSDPKVHLAARAAALTPLVARTGQPPPGLGLCFVSLVEEDQPNSWATGGKNTWIMLYNFRLVNKFIYKERMTGLSKADTEAILEDTDGSALDRVISFDPKGVNQESATKIAEELYEKAVLYGCVN